MVDATPRVAVVTGASSGIGAATARALAGDGWTVVVGARRVDRLEALAEEIGGRSHVLDVTDQASVDAFVATVPRCDLLVNNAGGGGQVVTVGSVAGLEPYPNGAGYNAAKFGVRAVMSALRQELLGRPVRVSLVDPGLVATEFSLVRFDGDADRAAAVYEGLTPLSADDVAECIRWIAARPPHVNIDHLLVLARDQAGARQIHRNPAPE